MSSGEFRRLESRVIFRDELLGLREDTVATPADALITRKVVEYRRSVAVIALTADDKAILVRHFRYPVGRVLWDLPGGILERSETVMECARRELLEEAGYEARRYEQVLEFYPEPAFTDHMITIVLAEEAAPSAAHGAIELEISEVGTFDLQDTPRLIHERVIGSSWTIIGMMLAFLRVTSHKERSD